MSGSESADLGGEFDPPRSVPLVWRTRGETPRPDVEAMLQQSGHRRAADAAGSAGDQHRTCFVAKIHTAGVSDPVHTFGSALSYGEALVAGRVPGLPRPS